MIANPGFHGRRHAQGLMDAPKVVEHEVQGHGMPQVLDLLAEAIGQAGEASHIHAHCEILPLNVTR